MKEKQVKRLNLGKKTIQNLDSPLKKEELNAIKGGTNSPEGTTDLVVYCSPHT